MTFLLMVFVHLSVALVVGQLFIREAAVFKYGPDLDPGFRDRVLDGSVGLGYSFYANVRLLNSCINGLQSFAQKLASAEDQAAYSGKCREFSDAILQNSPVNSLAWATNAIISQQSGNMVAMNEELVKAQKTSPNEQWLAVSRYQLAADNIAALTPPAKAAYDLDLALLAQSRFGVRAIASRYVSNPDFREHITDIVSKLPPDTQTRFLRSVRAVMSNPK